MTYASEQQQARRPRIHVAGGSDTTGRPYGHLPMAGWAQALPLFLTDAVEVVDCSHPRASSKSFRESGGLQQILEDMAPGDYLLFSFGQQDNKPDPEGHTDPFSTYMEYLAAYVHGVRERQGHPVVVLGHERRRLDRHGNAGRVLGDYPLAARQLADDEHVPVVDLYGQSLQWWEELGPEASKGVFAHLRRGSLGSKRCPTGTTCTCGPRVRSSAPASWRAACWSRASCRPTGAAASTAPASTTTRWAGWTRRRSACAQRPACPPSPAPEESVP
ncbi:SGNH/GDSL hydrolase family protein [Streptomyces globosus]|uniref:hypothetical protein n=1 Tax=Streptomyces globosus TaxID=68209 RepID=UPI003625991F